MKVVRKRTPSFATNLAKASPKLCAGIFANATRDVDDGQLQNSVKVAPYAAVQEFGSIHVPPRPFLRTTKQEKQGEWAKVLSERIRARNGDLRKAMNDMLSLVRGDIVMTVRHHTWQPLKPATIRAKERKGRPEPNKPLIDTASLIKSISAEVRG